MKCRLQITMHTSVSLLVGEHIIIYITHRPNGNGLRLSGISSFNVLAFVKLTQTTVLHCQIVIFRLYR